MVVAREMSTIDCILPVSQLCGNMFQIETLKYCFIWPDVYNRCMPPPRRLPWLWHKFAIRKVNYVHICFIIFYYFSSSIAVGVFWRFFLSYFFLLLLFIFFAFCCFVFLSQAFVVQCSCSSNSYLYLWTFTILNGLMCPSVFLALTQEKQQLWKGI